MSEYQYDDTQQIHTLTLDGELTIENIKVLRSTLWDALGRTDSLVINHNNAKGYDFSYLQLLISAIKTSESLGKEITFNENHNHNFLTLVKESGFINTKYFQFGSKKGT